MWLDVPVGGEVTQPSPEPGPQRAWARTARRVLGVLGPTCRARAAKTLAYGTKPLAWIPGPLHVPVPVSCSSPGMPPSPPARPTAAPPAAPATAPLPCATPTMLGVESVASGTGAGCAVRPDAIGGARSPFP
eukprot:6901165-Alexandrium_andersonii.AAC.1